MLASSRVCSSASWAALMAGVKADRSISGNMRRRASEHGRFHGVLSASAPGQGALSYTGDGHRAAVSATSWLAGPVAG